MSAKTHDDLDSIKIIINELEKFESKDQARIVRWVLEKIDLKIEDKIIKKEELPDTTLVNQVQLVHERNQDIKTFIASKNPSTDQHFAASVAYYYKFEAPTKDRKESINSEVLQDACRLTDRSRLTDPGKTLINANASGLLDKTQERGFYSINTVGENLVAMTLPNNSVTQSTKLKPKTKSSKKVKPKKK